MLRKYSYFWRLVSVLALVLRGWANSWINSLSPKPPWLAFLFGEAQALLSHASGQLRVHLESDGSYSVFVNDKLWLSSAATFFRANGISYSTSDGSLKQIGEPKAIAGSDLLGHWTGETLSYSADGPRVSVSVRTYVDDGGKLAIFTQSYDDDFKSTSASDKDKVASGFPSFVVGKTNASLGYLAYNGNFAGWMGNAAGRWTSDLPQLQAGIDSGPLLIFDKSGSVLVISALDSFMAASYEHDINESSISWGIMGKVNVVPKDFQYSTIMYYGASGINKAMLGWGKTLRKWYGRSVNQVDRQLDLSSDYIGYYTDNGAYYYYQTESGLNYEETLLKVVKYAKDNNIPYRYLQYDSWFYPKVNSTAKLGAVVTWDAKLSVFPHGMEYLYNQTLLPVVAHNRFWSDTTPYAKQNGGPFNFLFAEHGFALPDDQSFWDWLLCRAKLWGLVTYEQDWLNYQVTINDSATITAVELFVASQLCSASRGLLNFPRFSMSNYCRRAFSYADCRAWNFLPEYLHQIQTLSEDVDVISALQSDLWLGRRWLSQIGEAARRCGLTVQICMALPRHVLSALYIPSVTQVRASIDYHLDKKQYRVGITSLLVYALGLVPYKDTFWSTRVQPGNPYSKTEDNPKLQAVVSLLTTGPVGVSDKIGYTDIDLIRSLSTASGRLLHPSRPATATDVQMLEAAFSDGVGPKGQLWTTESVISGWLFGVILAAELAEPYSLKTSETGWDTEVFKASYVYTSKQMMGSWQAMPFNADAPLSLDSCSNYIEMCLYYTAPLLTAAHGGKFFLAGEMNKALPMSPSRAHSIAVSTEDTIVKLLGSPGELIDFDVCDVAEDAVSWSSPVVHCRTVQCVVSGSGAVTLSTLHGTCY